MQISLLRNPENNESLSRGEGGLAGESGVFFPMEGGVFRFVSESNYADNFSIQYTKFSRTQIDKYSGKDVSRNRFFKVTGWEKDALEGINILEAGCGAGRFSQIVLDHTEADLYSVDISTAIDANYRNNGPNERLNLFQADLYALPFVPGSFDKVFCFGVLQFTPDICATINCLLEAVKPGGEVVVDFYLQKGWWTKICAKYMLRPFLKNIGSQRLASLIDAHVDKMIGLYMLFKKWGIGRIANRFIPVCDIDKILPEGLSPEDLREWVMLDTFGMFSPKYDRPQRISAVKSYFEEAGAEVTYAGFVEHEPGKKMPVVRAKRKE